MAYQDQIREALDALKAEDEEESARQERRDRQADVDRSQAGIDHVMRRHSRRPGAARR